MRRPRLAALLTLLIGCNTFGLATAQNAPLTTPAVEDRYAENDGVRIHYVASGEGPLVILIHGFGDYSATWDSLAAALNDAYRVAAIDTRGYNLSDQPQSEAAYAMPQLVGDIAAVIASEKRTSATLVGHDWGGLIAWSVAITMREKVDDLVILAMPHPALLAKDIIAHPARYAGNPYVAMFREAGSEDKLTPEMLAAWVTDPVERAKYLAALTRSSRKAMMSYFRANDLPVASAAEEASGAWFNLPLMIIHGADDTFIPQSSQDDAWQYASNDSAKLVVPKAGHFVHRDAADLVNRSIRSWLDLHRK